MTFIEKGQLYGFFFLISFGYLFYFWNAPGKDLMLVVDSFLMAAVFYFVFTRIIRSKV